MSIKVMVVDDDELVRSSLKIILNMNPNMQVSETCSNGDEAFESISKNPDIDVILMDIRMPVCDGVLATKKILEVYPHVRIIILTTFDDDEYIFEALKNGAKGYLLKNVSADKVMEAIKIVYEGNMLIHPDIATKLSGMLKNDRKDFLDSYALNVSEKNIVKLIAHGYSNKEIGEKIYLSEGTVKNKISEILSKLNLRDRTQIAIFYLKSGAFDK
jgi:DNA-binding NarL/FixJ family response regulator